MSARLTFNGQQVDSLPTALHAIHLTLAALEQNAASKDYAVDWTTVEIEMHPGDDDLVIDGTCRYVRDDEDEPDGAPCCPDPGCPGNPCTFPGYADNH